MANESQAKSGSIGSGIFWMFLISLLLFWLPVVGPLIAGFVGGKKTGGVGSAISAVLLPAIVFAIILFSIATSLSSLPVIGAIAGGGGLILALAHAAPLLIGGIIGGSVA